MPSRQDSVGRLVRRVSALSRLFGPEIVDEKLATLSKLAGASSMNPEQLSSYHDAVCFMRAYPDSREVEQLAEQELKRFAKRIISSSRGRLAQALANSGIVGTMTSHPFGLEITQLLKSRYGSRVTISRENNPADWQEKLLDYLPHMVAWQENDAIDNDDCFDVGDFLERARSSRIDDELQGLLNLVNGSDLPKSIQRLFFESLDLEILWDLTKSPASRTLCRAPARKRFYFSEPLSKRCLDLRAELRKRSSPIFRLPETQGHEMIAIACEVLAVRNRELFPVTLANPAEIYRIEPGRGLQIFLFATPPEIRLPLESNFGAMFTRNGIPVAYGIAATLFDRVEIAINVFPAFRAGESAYILEQFFRAFYHHFGSRIFLVRSMQMGNDEEEALHSGSFWFYYKLGFRAIAKDVRHLADKEYGKQMNKAGYRTPLSTMKRLAMSDVVLFADADAYQNWREPSLAALGYRVTDYFATRHGGNRVDGARAAVDFVVQSLGINAVGSWSNQERLALKRLSPHLAGIIDLSKWKPAEKNALIRIIQTRGSGLERDYSLLCLKHKRLQAAIETLGAVRPGKQHVPRA